MAMLWGIGAEMGGWQLLNQMVENHVYASNRRDIHEFHSGILRQSLET